MLSDFDQKKNFVCIHTREFINLNKRPTLDYRMSFRKKQQFNRDYIEVMSQTITEDDG